MVPNSDRHGLWLVRATVASYLGLMVLGSAFLGFACYAAWRYAAASGPASAPFWLLGLPALLILGWWGRLAWKQHHDVRYPGLGRRLIARAQDGGAEASLHLGLAYLHGDQGLPRDDSSAHFHLQRAAQLGSAEAMVQLADLILGGQGCLRDGQAARAWLERARDLGHPGARRRLVRLPAEAMAAGAE